MKSRITVIAFFGLCAGLVAGCGPKTSTSWQSIKDPAIAAQLKSFVAEKQAQAKLDAPNTPREFKTFFAAAEKGDWIGVSNAFAGFQNHAPQYQHSGKPDERLRGTAWQTV